LNGQKLRTYSARKVRALFGFIASAQSGFSLFAHAQRARGKSLNSRVRAERVPTVFSLTSARLLTPPRPGLDTGVRALVK